MATNNLKEILINEGITITALAKTSGLSYSFAHSVVHEKKSGTPRSQSKIVKGLAVLTQKTYTREELFPPRKAKPTIKKTTSKKKKKE